MREIKFRAWTGSMMEYRVVAGELGAFYVQGIDPEDAASISTFNTIYSEQTSITQYTGLTDKNGKEIYEGDILANNDANWEVGFGEGGYWMRLRERQHKFVFINEAKHSEIIGNIHEHPNLLTNEK
jgi:uncharacterized phage protein (TIGR01671 family)